MQRLEYTARWPTYGSTESGFACTPMMQQPSRKPSPAERMTLWDHHAWAGFLAVKYGIPQPIERDTP